MFRAGTTRWRLVSVAIAAILLVWGAFWCDDAVIRWVAEHQTRALKHAAGAISHYGDWPFLMAAGLCALALFWRLGRARWMHIVCLMMLSSTISGVLVNTVRLTSGRTRPNAPVPQGWYGLRYQGKWIMGDNKFRAFPSGHTGAAIGFFAPPLLLAPGVGVPAFVLGGLIGVSRIYLGAHHLSDVLVASLVAFAVSIGVCRRWPDGFRRNSPHLTKPAALPSCNAPSKLHNP